MNNLKTLFANINKAARDNQTVKIGGGKFSPAELTAAITDLHNLRIALNNMTTLAAEAIATREADEDRNESMLELLREEHAEAVAFVKGLES